MSTELVATSDKRTALKTADEGRFFGLPPKEMVVQATEIANALKDVIEKQKLFSQIGGNKHIRVEGWQTLGTLLGILPDEEYVKEHTDGAFEAKIALVNMKTGVKVGGASSLCGMDEKKWSTAPKFSRRSMAITRATGKAYKQSFGWIVTLAGYQATPAEEMDGVELDTKQQEPQQVTPPPAKQAPAKEQPKAAPVQQTAPPKEPAKKNPNGFDPNNPEHEEYLEKLIVEYNLQAQTKSIVDFVTGKSSAEIIEYFKGFKK